MILKSGKVAKSEDCEERRRKWCVFGVLKRLIQSIAGI